MELILGNRKSNVTLEYSIQQIYSLCLHSELLMGHPGYSFRWGLSRSPRSARWSPGSVLGAPLLRTQAHRGSLDKKVIERAAAFSEFISQHTSQGRKVVEAPQSKTWSLLRISWCTKTYFRLPVSTQHYKEETSASQHPAYLSPL